MPTAFHLGFQVRVELILADGAPLTAQITRDEEELLELDRYRSSTCARTARARSAASRKGYCDVQASGGAASARTSSGERLAEAQAIPLTLLERILSELRNAGIVSTWRGADGGYLLARPPGEITLADVMRAVKGRLANVDPHRQIVLLIGRARRSRATRS